LRAELVAQAEDWKRSSFPGWLTSLGSTSRRTAARSSRRNTETGTSLHAPPTPSSRSATSPQERRDMSSREAHNDSTAPPYRRTESFSCRPAGTNSRSACGTLRRDNNSERSAGKHWCLRMSCFTPTARISPRPDTIRRSGSGMWPPVRPGRSSGATEGGRHSRVQRRRQDARLGQLRSHGPGLERGHRRAVGRHGT
jgi:hypothetical protein